TVVLMNSPFWNYFASIALGVSAIVARETLGEWHRTTIAIGLLSLAILIGFFAIGLEIIPYRVGAPLVAISIVLVLAQPGTPSKVAEFLGGISYPMYLNHWLGMYVAHALFTNFGMRGSFVSEVSGVVFAM